MNRYRAAALLTVAIVYGITGISKAQSPRPQTLTSVIKIGLTPQGLSPYSVTGPEYAMILTAATAADAEFTGVSQKRTDLDTARREVRIAEARTRLAEDDEIASTDLANSISQLESVRAEFNMARNELVTNILGQHVTAQELAALLATMNNQHPISGSSLIPWGLLQPDQQEGVRQSLIAFNKPTLNPNDAALMSYIRNLLAGIGSAPLIEFDMRLDRCHAMATAAGQWMLGG